MTRETVNDICKAFPGAEVSDPWGGGHDAWKVGGKMFAVRGSAGGLSFKASDLAFEVLTEGGPARPAPYLARTKWVRFDDLDGLDPDEVADWLATAHGLVAAKLTRAQRREIGLA